MENSLRPDILTEFYKETLIKDSKNQIKTFKVPSRVEKVSETNKLRSTKGKQGLSNEVQKIEY